MMLFSILVLTGCVFASAQENAPAVDHYKKLKPGTKIYFHNIDDKLMVGPKLNSDGDVTIYTLGDDGVFKSHNGMEDAKLKSVKYSVTKNGVLVPKPGGKSIKYNYNQNGDLVPDTCNQCVFRSDKPTYYVKGFKNILIPVEMLYSKNKLHGLFKDKILFTKALEGEKQVEKEISNDWNRTTEIAPLPPKNLGDGIVPDKACNGEITLFILKSDGSLKRTPSDPYLPPGMKLSYRMIDNLLLKPLFEKKINDFVMSYLTGKDGDLIPSGKNEHEIKTEPGSLLSFMLGERGIIFPVKEMMDAGNSVSYYFNGNLVHNSRQFSEVFANATTVLINNERFQLPDLKTGPSLVCDVNGLCERKRTHRTKRSAPPVKVIRPYQQQYAKPAPDRYAKPAPDRYAKPAPNQYQYQYETAPGPVTYETVEVPCPCCPPAVPSGYETVEPCPCPPPQYETAPCPYPSQVILPPFGDPDCDVPSLPSISQPSSRTSFVSTFKAPVNTPTYQYQKSSTFSSSKPCNTCPAPQSPIPEAATSCNSPTIIVNNCKCPVPQPPLCDLPAAINGENCECKDPKLRTDIYVEDCKGKEIAIVPEITDQCDVVLYKLTCKGQLVRFPQCTEPEFGYDIVFELCLDEFILIPTSRPKKQFTLTYALQENGNLIPEKYCKNTFKKAPGSLLYFMLGKNNILFPVQSRYECDGSLSYFFQNQFLVRILNPVNKPVYFTTLGQPIYAYVNNLLMITCSSKPRINSMRGSNWRKFRSEMDSGECCSKDIYLTGPNRQNIKICPYISKKGIPVIYELDCNGVFYRSPKDKKKCVILRSYMMLKEKILIPLNETDGYIYAEAKNGDMYPYLFPGGKISAPVGQSVKYLLCRKGVLLPVCVEVIGDYICYLFKDVVVYRERVLCKRGFGDSCECLDTCDTCNDKCKDEPPCELFEDENGNHVYFEKDGKYLRRHPEECVPENVIGKEGSFKIESDGKLTSIPPEEPHDDVISLIIDKCGDLEESCKNQKEPPCTYYVLAKNADLIPATVRRTKTCITLYSKCGRKYFKVCEKKICGCSNSEWVEEKDDKKCNCNQDENDDTKCKTCDRYNKCNKCTRDDGETKSNKKCDKCPEKEKCTTCNRGRYTDKSGSPENNSNNDRDWNDSGYDTSERFCNTKASWSDPLRLFEGTSCPKKSCDNAPLYIDVPIPIKNANIEDTCKTCPAELKKKCEKWRDALKLLTKDCGLPMNLELQMDTKCIKDIRDWAEKCDKVIQRKDLMGRFNTCLKNLEDCRSCKQCRQ